MHTRIHRHILLFSMLLVSLIALPAHAAGEPLPVDPSIKVLKLENGFLIIPDEPGLGIELAEDAQERYPYKPRTVNTRLHVDGSVVDQ